MRDDLERTHARIAQSLRTSTRRALRAAAQVATVSLAACASGNARPAAAPEQEKKAPATDAVTRQDACTSENARPFTAAGLTPKTAVDYIAIRNVQVQPPMSANEPPRPEAQWILGTFNVESEAGKQCASAHDDACLAKVAKHPDQPSNPHCVQACGELSVVTTRGDEVARHASEAELVALLAPIDTPQEAALLVNARHYTVACGGDSPVHIAASEQGYRVSASRLVSTCPVVTVVDDIDVRRDGTMNVVGSSKPHESGMCIGRLTAGLALSQVAPTGTALAKHLAGCAELEACAVLAFDRLIRELTHHGAPPLLLRLAERARADEVRHAQDVGALARRFGSEPNLTPRACETPVRSLREIAEENAVEGCVRETYGALVGAFQAEHAEDARVRGLMARIAKDELRHATLSHLIHGWILTQLDDAVRADVQAAARTARAELELAATRATDDALARALGLPTPAQASALLSALVHAA